MNWIAYSDGTQAHRVGTFDSEKKLWKTVEKGIELTGREYSFDIEIQIVDENKVVWRGGGYKVGDESVPPLEFVFTRVATDKDQEKKPTKSKD